MAIQAGKAKLDNCTLTPDLPDKHQDLALGRCTRSDRGCTGLFLEALAPGQQECLEIQPWLMTGTLQV